MREFSAEIAYYCDGASRGNASVGKVLIDIIRDAMDQKKTEYTALRERVKELTCLYSHRAARHALGRYARRDSPGLRKAAAARLAVS